MKREMILGKILKVAICGNKHVYKMGATALDTRSCRRGRSRCRLHSGSLLWVNRKASRVLRQMETSVNVTADLLSATVKQCSHLDKVISGVNLSILSALTSL